MIKDFFKSAGTNVIILVFSLAQGILISRLLKTEGRGEIAIYIGLYNMIYAFSNLGIRQSSSFFLSKKNYAVELIRKIQLSVISIATVLTTIILVVLFQTEGLYNTYNQVFLILTAPFALYTTYTTSFALSYRWIWKLNIVKILICVITFSGIFIFFGILGEKELHYFFISMFAANFITAIYVFSWARKIEGYTPRFKVGFSKEFFLKQKEIVFKGITYAFPLFIYGINFKVDLLILNRFLDKGRIGIYSVGVTFAEMIWQLPMILSMLIFSYSISEKNPDKFSFELWKKNKRVMLLLLPILIVYAIGVHFAIPFLYGDEFADSSMITILLLPGTYAIVSFNILNADMAARGHPTAALKIFSFGAIINIGLNLLLMKDYNIYGACIASSVSYAISSALFARKFYFKLITPQL